MSLAKQTLIEKRESIEKLRSRFDGGHNAAIRGELPVSEEIFNSWQRSLNSNSDSADCAPMIDQQQIDDSFQQSPISASLKAHLPELKQLVDDGQFVAALSDPNGRLVWTYASGYMKRKAENLNFTKGGVWAEDIVGTNAIGLSLKTGGPVSVFSLEHYSPFVQDWVCYAAPIIDPVDGRCMGVLDISTTWKKHSPLGLPATIELARSMAPEIRVQTPKAELELYALGKPSVRLHGRPIALTPRQQEILCLLALHRDGLNLQAIHSEIHADRNVSVSTTKAEISHLRTKLGGVIGSRPYRIMIPYWTDFNEIWKVLETDVEQALSLYRGALLPWSNSTVIHEWQRCLDAAVQNAIGQCRDQSVLSSGLQSGCHSAVLERLVELNSPSA